jgi:uncharacterized protein
MPANLTPQYKKVEEQYRAATTDEERIPLLEEMLRIIPKHKGTEHIQAELKRKLSHLKDASTAKKGHGKTVDIFHVPRGGAGQVVLLGMPNSGKSSIVEAMTKANVHVADFPFATTVPTPGMANFEDVQIQLVDMPPITAEYSAPGQVGTYRNCDIIGVVIDLSGDTEEQVLVCLDFLESKNLICEEKNGEEKEEPNRLIKKVLCIGTKLDEAVPGAMENLKQLCGKYPFEFIAISTKTAEGMGEFVKNLFRLLNIIRVYAKPPGKEPDMKAPFTIPVGSTVMDLATLIHRDLAEKLKTARIWGNDVHPGQNVHRTHELHDKDIIELHF